MYGFFYRNRICQNGRWISRDPIGYFNRTRFESACLYEYVKDNPTLYGDPLGLFPPTTKDHVLGVITDYLDGLVALGPIFQCVSFGQFKNRITTFLESRPLTSFRFDMPIVPSHYDPRLNVLWILRDASAKEVLHESLHFFDDFENITGGISYGGGINEGLAEKLTYGMELTIDKLLKMNMIYNEAGSGAIPCSAAITQAKQTANKLLGRLPVFYAVAGTATPLSRDALATLLPMAGLSIDPQCICKAMSARIKNMGSDCCLNCEDWIW